MMKRTEPLQVTLIVPATTRTWHDMIDIACLALAELAVWVLNDESLPELLPRIAVPPLRRTPSSIVVQTNCWRCSCWSLMLRASSTHRQRRASRLRAGPKGEVRHYGLPVDCFSTSSPRASDALDTPHRVSRTGQSRGTTCTPARILIARCVSEWPWCSRAWHSVG
jgi:hypothetical protein